ncbi:MAG: S41 family peptidase [Oscillospiraceae bacterium]|nr:S41 family peptidase [Oscillospiraceae bacterium]
MNDINAWSVQKDNRNRRYTAQTVATVALLTAIATLLLAFLGFRHLYGMHSETWQEASRIHEARRIISTYYVGTVDEALLTEAAIAASVAALGDNWSRYLTAEQYAAHLQAVGNRQQGIGISFERDEETNEIVVMSTTPGSPAEEAGLVYGDVILTVAGWDSAKLSNDEVRQIIGEHYGGAVSMDVRDAAGETRAIYVEVRAFFVNPVTFEMLEGEIGYIRIANFDVGSADEVILAIEALLEDGAESLVFDVRGNPGGRVTELLWVLDHLLPEGEIFVFEDYAGNESVRYAGPGYLEIPMVVLVNGWSASAAEFFAAILQEREWATIVGTGTSGKSRSQVIIPLMGGDAIVLSTSRYLTPGRVDLYERGGIRPDVWVENVGDGVDRQLGRAREILGG